LKAFETIALSEPDKGLLEVTLSRPNQLNALNMQTIDDLSHLIRELQGPLQGKYQVVLLRGEGRAFSSGGDLTEFLTIYPEDKSIIENYIAKFLRLTKVWYELPIPTIASVHGAVAGGGASLALACDIRIAAENTKFQFVFSRIGLIPDMGAHYLLPKIIGEAKSLDLLYTGRPVSSKEALEIGLVHQVVEGLTLQEKTIEYARPYLDGPLKVYQHIKQLIKSNQMTLDEILNQETTIQTDRFKSEEFKRFINQFLQKKK